MIIYLLAANKQLTSRNIDAIATASILAYNMGLSLSIFARQQLGLAQRLKQADITLVWW